MERLNMPSIKNIEKKLFYVLFAGIFLFMALLNLLTPYLADDFIRAGQQHFIAEGIRAYFNWGGRILPVFMSGPFFLLPKVLFDVANAAVFTIFVLLIYLYAIPKRNHNVPQVLFICLTLWIFTIDFGQVYLWQLGAIAYLWSVILILVFILPYYRYAMKGGDAKHPGRAIAGMILLGILGGSGGETTSGGGILLVIFLIVFGKRTGKAIRPWQVAGLIASIGAFVVMIMAPGNGVRASYFTEPDGLLRILSHRFWHCTKYLESELRYLLIGYFVLIVIQLVTSKERKNVWVSVAFFCAFILTDYSMILAPTGTAAGRSFFGATAFLFIACAQIFSTLTKNKDSIAKIATACLLLIMGLQFLFTAPPAMNDIYNYYEAYEEREAIVLTEKSKHIEDVVVPEIVLPEDKHSGGYDLADNVSSDPKFYVNIGFADYYGLNSVRSVPIDDWEDIKMDYGIE